MTKFSKTTGFIALSTAAALVLAGCATTTAPEPAASDGAPAVEPAELTYVLPSAVIAPKEEVAALAVAEAMGYFAEESLTVEIVNADGSVAAIQAIASGSADVTGADAGSILAGAQNGVGVSAIGGLVQNWPWEIATLPGSGIESAEDLKGKNIGVISLASGSAPYARAFVNSAGLDDTTDVNLLPVGVGAQAQAALESGQVDVLALYTQAYAALENEGVELEYLENPDVFDGLRSITIAAGNDAVAAEPEVYTRFLRAVYKAMLFSSVNPEAAMQIGYEVFPQLLDGSTVEERLDKDVNSLTAWLETATPTSGEPAEFTDWGAISDEDWQATQEYMILAGQITAEVELDSVWISDLLEEANDFDSAAVVAQAEAWTP